MSVYKDKNGKWKVYYRYTDWTGKKKQTTKRGFETKREAVAWEREQHLKMKSSLNMTFGSFVEIYITPESVKLIFSKARKTHSYCVYRMFLSKIAIHLSGECIAW
jgi:hypothetical protein